MILSLYKLASNLVEPLLYLYLRRRLARGKEDAQRFDERLGLSSTPRPDGGLVWVHAASVGEAISMLPVIERTLQTHKGLTVLLTTGTVTSARLMADRLPKGAIHQYVPADAPRYVRRFLDHWKPDLALWAESEFWPNLVSATHARNIDMILLNARMSERSFSNWKRYRGLIGQLLSAFSIVLAQSKTDGERLHQLGATQVETHGNLKYAGQPLPVDEAALDALKQQTQGRPVWLAASTHPGHPGEENIAADVHLKLESAHPNLLTIIVPRHPERGAAIAAELKMKGLKVARRSADESITQSTQIYIADTLGELGLFYRLVPVCFIGKTLAAGGGQNPLEAAWLNCAIVFGPDISNFVDIAQSLLDQDGAVQVSNSETLGENISLLLGDHGTAQKMAKTARAEAQAQSGVLDRIMAALEPGLTKAEDGPHANT